MAASSSFFNNCVTDIMIERESLRKKRGRGERKMGGRKRVNRGRWQWRGQRKEKQNKKRKNLQLRLFSYGD